MEFQEYPKALYRGEDMQVVFHAAGEALARAEGYAEWRPAGAAAPVEPVAAIEPGEVPAAPAKRKTTRKAQ